MRCSIDLEAPGGEKCLFSMKALTSDTMDLMAETPIQEYPGTLERVEKYWHEAASQADQNVLFEFEFEHACIDAIRWITLGHYRETFHIGHYAMQYILSLTPRAARPQALQLAHEDFHVVDNG